MPFTLGSYRYYMFSNTDHSLICENEQMKLIYTRKNREGPPGKQVLGSILPMMSLL